jgi:hypothetical protein
MTAHRPIAVSKKVYARPGMLKSPTPSYHRHKLLRTKNADSVKMRQDSAARPMTRSAFTGPAWKKAR